MSRFSRGVVVATPGAIDLMRSQGVFVNALLKRHQDGDWGDCGEGDANLNEESITDGNRLMSVYRLGETDEVLEGMDEDTRRALPTIWVITESDRSVTTLLLPEEY